MKWRVFCLVQNVLSSKYPSELNGGRWIRHQTMEPEHRFTQAASNNTCQAVRGCGV